MYNKKLKELDVFNSKITDIKNLNENLTNYLSRVNLSEHSINDYLTALKMTQKLSESTYSSQDIDIYYKALMPIISRKMFETSLTYSLTKVSQNNVGASVGFDVETDKGQTNGKTTFLIRKTTAITGSVGSDDTDNSNLVLRHKYPDLTNLGIFEVKTETGEMPQRGAKNVEDYTIASYSGVLGVVNDTTSLDDDKFSNLANLKLTSDIITSIPVTLKSKMVITQEALQNLNAISDMSLDEFMTTVNIANVRGDLDHYFLHLCKYGYAETTGDVSISGGASDTKDKLWYAIIDGVQKIVQENKIDDLQVCIVANSYTIVKAIVEIGNSSILKFDETYINNPYYVTSLYGKHPIFNYATNLDIGTKIDNPRKGDDILLIAKSPTVSAMNYAPHPIIMNAGQFDDGNLGLFSHLRFNMTPSGFSGLKIDDTTKKVTENKLMKKIKLRGDSL